MFCIGLTINLKLFLRGKLYELENKTFQVRSFFVMSCHGLDFVMKFSNTLNLIDQKSIVRVFTQKKIMIFT